MLKKIVEWFIQPQLSDIEKYVTAHNPTSPADVEILIREFNCKRGLQCF